MFNDNSVIIDDCFDELNFLFFVGAVVLAVSSITLSTIALLASVELVTALLEASILLL